MTNELVSLGLDLVHEVGAKGAYLRLFGGVAIHVLVKDPILTRPAPRDIDCVCLSGDILAVLGVLHDFGYQEDLAVTRLFGTERRRFAHSASGTRLDLCIDHLRFCRPIDLRRRIEVRPVTISVADLLLSKLQVYDPTDVDVRDCIILLNAFAPGNTEGPGEFDVSRIAALCAHDWGLYQLAEAALAATDETLRAVPELTRHAALLSRVEHLRDCIRHDRKSVLWRMRALIGARVQYWNNVTDE